MFSNKDTVSSGLSGCVKIEPLESDISEMRSAKDAFLKVDNLKVKLKKGCCHHCPNYSTDTMDKLKYHLLTLHPTEGTIVTNNSFETTHLKLPDVTFLCAKETCSHASTLCNVYEEHLMQCYAHYPALSQNEVERLKASLRYIFDYHRKHSFKVVPGFLNFVFSFVNNYVSKDDFFKSLLSYLLERELDIQMQNGSNCFTRTSVSENPDHSSTPTKSQRELRSSDSFSHSSLQSKGSTTSKDNDNQVSNIKPREAEKPHPQNLFFNVSKIHSRGNLPVAGWTDIEIDIADNPLGTTQESENSIHNAYGETQMIDQQIDPLQNDIKMEIDVNAQLRVRAMPIQRVEVRPVRLSKRPKTIQERSTKSYMKRKEEDPDRHKDYLSAKKEYSKRWREKKKEMETEEEKAIRKAKTRDRVARWRSKQKQQVEKDPICRDKQKDPFCKNKPHKPRRRKEQHQIEEFRKKDRERKRAERAQWSWQKKKSESLKASERKKTKERQ